MRRNFLFANLLAAALIAGVLAWVFYAVLGMLAGRASWGTVWEYRGALWSGWLTTLGMSVAALAGSVVFGLMFFLGQRSHLVVVRWSCRGLLEFIRDTPLLVHLLFGYFVIFGMFSQSIRGMGVNDKIVIGIFILALFAGAYLGEILRGGVESIPQTQWESARAVGFSTRQMYRYVIFPQALRRVLPAVAGLFVSLIKDSSLLNVIGATEYFYNTKNFINRTYAGLEGYIPLALGYLLLTLPVAWLSHWLERRFRDET